jgi:hypothetical protein
MHWLNLQEGKRRARNVVKVLYLQRKGSAQMENTIYSRWPLDRVERVMVRTRSAWHPYGINRRTGKGKERLTLQERRFLCEEQEQMADGR